MQEWGDEEGGIKLWDVQSRRCVATFKGHEGSVISIVFSPDGRWLAVLGDKTIKLWEVRLRLCLPSGGVLDGVTAVWHRTPYLLVYAQGTLYLFHLQQGDLLAAAKLGTPPSKVRVGPANLFQVQVKGRDFYLLPVSSSLSLDWSVHSLKAPPSPRVDLELLSENPIQAGDTLRFALTVENKGEGDLQRFMAYLICKEKPELSRFIPLGRIRSGEKVRRKVSLVTNRRWQSQVLHFTLYTAEAHGYRLVRPLTVEVRVGRETLRVVSFGVHECRRVREVISAPSGFWTLLLGFFETGLLSFEKATL